jgi:hypothetical protein
MVVVPDAHILAESIVSGWSSLAIRHRQAG